MNLSIVKNKFLLVVVAVTMVLAACSTTKKTGVNGSNTTKVTTESDMRVELRTVIDSYGDWSRLRVPVTLSLRQPKNIAISGTAIMERGKSVFISLKYFGIEIGNLYVTDDSIMVVDKVHKAYVGESVGHFLSGFDVNVSNLQDLLLGHVFVPGSQKAEISGFSNAEFENVDGGSWLLLPASPSPDIEFGYSFSPIDVLAGLMVKAGCHQPFTCEYASPISTPFGPMSPGLTLQHSMEKTAIEASIEWNLSKAKWDGEVELRQPSVSQKYKRISSSEISKIISNF